jgi:4-hydroxythreonine-4-phosphate dehydrogenase
MSKSSTQNTKMSDTIAPIALTIGEPAGIGPDIILALLQEAPSVPICLFGDPACLEQRAKQLGLPAQLLSQPHLDIETVKLNSPHEAGHLNVNNASSVVESIRLATQACLDKRCRALVTNPVHKGIINEAGINFTGHTEFLASLTNTKKTVMLLASPQLKVALATTHLALSKVPKAITEASLTRCIEILDHDLQVHFNIASPHILVCGLNPHAGEAGHFGDEEIRVIIPALEKLRQKGYQLTGPVSADTAFIAGKNANVDAVLAMYHDQGLPAIKTQDFGETVNITLGLPIVRTSVDHGTALSLAGTGKALNTSLKTALHYADVLSSQLILATHP